LPKKVNGEELMALLVGGLVEFGAGESIIAELTNTP
jgi:hypothetical protein